MRRRLMRRAFLADIPVNDWIALGLLAWMLAMVGWSVQLAKWGELPNIVPTALFGTAIAFLMAKLRIRRSTGFINWTIPLNFAAFLIAGIVIVFWQASLNAEGSNPIARAYDAWDRFGIWIDIAINGGVSGDQIPFAMMMMTATWVTAYVVTFLTFRFNSPWIPAVILGTRASYEPQPPHRNARADFLSVHVRSRRPLLSSRRRRTHQPVAKIWTHIPQRSAMDRRKRRTHTRISCNDRRSHGTNDHPSFRHPQRPMEHHIPRSIHTVPRHRRKTTRRRS